MKKFHCKFCKRVMKVTGLEFKSNQYCNLCFNERAKLIHPNKVNSFYFMGVEIPLD